MAIISGHKSSDMLCAERRPPKGFDKCVVTRSYPFARVLTIFPQMVGTLQPIFKGISDPRLGGNGPRNITFNSLMSMIKFMPT